MKAPLVKTTSDYAASLCFDCAKDQSLRSFIRNHGRIGPRCEICLRRDLIASVPEASSGLVSLLRALLRYHYDEWTYNPHWGGANSPVELLMRQNPILEHLTTSDDSSAEERLDSFLQSVFSPGYYPYQKGVSLYAGHLDGIGRLPPMYALSTSTSPILKSMIDNLRTTNYFDLESQFEERLAKLGSHLLTHVKKGEIFYRARIGFAERFIRSLGFSSVPDLGFQPYLEHDIGALFPSIAKAGRLNRHGVSFLYISTDERTAATEVRPHPGHLVSLGAFRAKSHMRLMDFGSARLEDFAASDYRLDLFHLAHSVDQAMSVPVTPEESHRYTVTQLVAEIVRRKGYHGVRYRSSISSGANLCIFRPSLLDYIHGSAKIVRVATLRYKMEKLVPVIEPGDEDISLDRT